MSYKDRHGSTPINKGKSNNLTIHWDYDDDSEDIKQRTPILFYTPWMEDTNTHYHIRLDKDQAKIMRDWLDEYLKEQASVESKNKVE